MDLTKENSVLDEQINSLYRGFPALVFINLTVGLFLVYGLWSVVPHQHLIVWFACLIAMLVVRFVFFLRHKLSPNTSRHQLATFLVLGSAAAGLIWGLGGVFLLPEGELAYQLFIFFVLLGMGSGSSSSLAMYLPAYYAFFPATIIPIGIKLLTMGETIYLALGAMAFVYFVALTILNRNVNRSLKEALMLRHENSELVSELRIKKDEAEIANIAKSKFLAAASHDLRQPLHALTLFTQTLSDSVESPKIQTIADQISTSVGSLENLFDALLDISQLDAGVIQVNKTNFDLQALFVSLKKDFQTDADEKGLELSCVDTETVVYTDVILINQILRNYISNAIRYTSEGSIVISSVTENDDVTISVSDTGFGISEQDQEAIYEEFHQLFNPERNREKGLGLGLAIVKRSANLLDCKINLNSTLGKGSIFSITVKSGSLEPVSEPSPPRPDSFTSPQYDAVILVIDDDSAVLSAMQGLLELWGCKVIAAKDMFDALSQLESSNLMPDGIIADFRLPNEMTGIQAVEKIHTMFNTEIPTLILTGDTSVDKVKEVINSKYQVLFKPISPLKLRAFLQRVTSKVMPQQTLQTDITQLQ